MKDSSAELPLVADVVEAWAPTGGGIRSYVEAKAEIWTRTGRARHLLVVPGPRSRVVSTGLRTVVEIRGPRIPGCAPYRFLLSQRRLREALESFRPDVIELGSQYLAGATALSCRESSGAIVSSFFHTDVAGAYVGPLVRRFGGNALSALLEARVRERFVELGRRVDLTLVSSPAHAAVLRQLGLPRLHPLSLGVDLDVFRPEAAVHPAERPGLKSPASCLFVFVGRLDREKRVPLLLEAFRKARTRSSIPRLLLVGEGPLASEVQAAADASGGWLEFQPFETDRRRVARTLASSDVYVTAGPHETFGLAVLEAQACGLPVLGVRAGALQERVPEGTGAGWLVPPDDVGALAREILRIAELPPPVRARVGATGRMLAIRSGGWEECLASLSKLYGLPEPAPGSEAAESKLYGLPEPASGSEAADAAAPREPVAFESP